MGIDETAERAREHLRAAELCQVGVLPSIAQQEAIFAIEVGWRWAGMKSGADPNNPAVKGGATAHRVRTGLTADYACLAEVSAAGVHELGAKYPLDAGLGIADPIEAKRERAFGGLTIMEAEGNYDLAVKIMDSAAVREKDILDRMQAVRMNATYEEGKVVSPAEAQIWIDLAKKILREIGLLK